MVILVRRVFIFLCLLLTITTLVACGSVAKENGEEPSVTSNPESEIEEKIALAWEEIKEEVLSQLKAPSTAKFPTVNELKDFREYKPGEYIVHGYVDAENSYGAMIRTDFVAYIILETGEINISWDE